MQKAGWFCCLLGGKTKGDEEGTKGKAEECLVFVDTLGTVAKWRLL
jgi:hypothetical protein